MIARAYDPERSEDVNALAKMRAAGDDIDPAKDIVVFVCVAGEVTAIVGMRPCLYVHDFSLRPGALQREATDLAMCYAMGAARAMGHREGITIVGDEHIRMKRWWEEHGARQQPAGSVYCVEIK